MILRSTLALTMLLGAPLAAEKKPAPAPKEVLRIALPPTPLMFSQDFIQRSLMKTAGYSGLTHSPERPAAIKKEPAYKGRPMYGILTLGNTTRAEVVVAVDDEAGKVYLDANQNGDLTDDAPVAWSWQSNGGKKEERGSESKLSHVPLDWLATIGLAYVPTSGCTFIKTQPYGSNGSKRGKTIAPRRGRYSTLLL